MGVTYTTTSAATYVPIATQTLGSATASVTFSSIPSTYTDLVIIANHKGIASPNGLYVTLNSDGTAIYSDTFISGNGTSATSGRNTGLSASYIGSANATDFTLSKINVMNYANTTTYKSLLSRSDLASTIAEAHIGFYPSTSAITTILLSYYGNNFAIGCTFTLYGILGA